MVDFINILNYLLFTLVIGFVFIKLINPKLKLNLKIISLVYGLGSGAIGLEMFFISLAGFKFSLGLILFPWSVPLLIVLYNTKKEIKNHLHFKNLLINIKDTVGNINIVLSLGFILMVLPFFLEILAGSPSIGWDTWGNWGFKAKIFYLERQVPLNLYVDKFSIVPSREYPLLTSLIETFFYFFLGRFDDAMIKVVFFFFYICLLTYFYSIFKELYNKLQAYLFTFLLTTIPIFVSFASGYYNGYADLIFTYFNFISVTLLWHWTIKKERSLFYLSSIFTGLALWTKVDGIVLLFVNLICLFFLGLSNIKNTIIKTKLFFIYILIPLIIAGPWYLIVALLRFPSVHIRIGPSLLSIFTDFKRLPILGSRFLQEALSFSDWNILWFIFLLLLILCFARLFNNHKFLFINTLLQLGLYAFIVVIDVDYYRAIWNSLSRLMIHLVPLIFILIAGVIFQKESEQKSIC